MFIGRIKELNELKSCYLSSKTEIISVLGRRRVGKSQLIFNSYQDFDGLVIAYECSLISYHDNLSQISELIRDKFNNQYLSFSSIYDVLNFLYRESQKQKILFVLDEYPYLRIEKMTDSEIKKAIDEFNLAQKDYPFKFVICGSAVDVMNVLDDASMPLHGRFTKIINLFPLNYIETSLFYPSFSFEDKIKFYTVFGGVPYYAKQVNPHKSFEENIINLFFSDNALLKSELENQIYGEINKIEKATYILNIIRDKTLSYNDILTKFKSSFPKSDIDYALNKLLNLKIVEKIYIEQNNGKKKPYYHIVDYGIAFYYSFLNVNVANRLLYSNQEYYSSFIKDKLLHDYIPHKFEAVCMQFVCLMNRHNLLPYRLTDVFSYLINDEVNKTNYQFDIVGKTEKGLINFECKFIDHPLKQIDYEKETKQAIKANQNFIDTIFISKSNVESSSISYKIDDLFNEILLKE